RNGTPGWVGSSRWGEDEQPGPAGTAAHARRGRRDVQGGSQDRDAVGQGRQALVDQDAGRAPALPGDRDRGTALRVGHREALIARPWTVAPRPRAFVARDGIEPPTPRFSAACSTN